jgi:diadenosine tetraphosphate (Ap4A) HIT family hydrolase
MESALHLRTHMGVIDTSKLERKLTRQRESAASTCFLCEPASELVYLDNGGFYAMAGLGPIVDGYSVVATREHVPSTLDLSPGQVARLGGFIKAVRAELEPQFGAVTFTEHGRVAACVYADSVAHEAHCMHAHRLAFPGVPGLDLAAVAPRLDVSRHPSFAVASADATIVGQYLLVEEPDGSCQLASVNGPLPRQFLRAAVAAQIGARDLADWRSQPGLERIVASIEALR